MAIIRLFLSIVLFAIIHLQVNAQLLDPVSYELSEVPGQVQAGELFTVTVRAEIEGDWHLYSALNDPDAGPFPTTFTSAAENLVIAGNISETEPKIVLDPNFNAKLGWHSNKAYFTVPLAFDTLSQGEEFITLDILYQVCDDKSCLPPKTKQVSTEVTVAGIAETPFITADNTSQNVFFSLYRSPGNLISAVEDCEWIFWLTGVFVVSVFFYFIKKKYRL